MTEIYEQLSKVIESGSLSPEDADKIILAQILSLNERLYRVEQTNSNIEKKVDELLCNLANHNKNNEKQETRVSALEKSQKINEEYPSITYLLRFHTKETIALIIILFVILSIWYVSEFRESFLRWLGLPVF